jgi:hypothetical protein
VARSRTELIVYPGLFRVSDDAALRAQRRYFHFLCLQLALFSLTSLLGALAGVPGLLLSDRAKHGVFLAIAVILALAMLVLWTLRLRRYEKVWFDCRAIAESTKTATWRYMMRASPFHVTESQNEVDGRFVSELNEIKQARAGASVDLIDQSPDVSYISDTMRQTRGMSVEERYFVYLEDRLRDERAWYESKASKNRASGFRWFVLTACLQAIGLIFAILKAGWLDLPVNFSSFLMTVAASFTAWTQANKNEELANSYSLAAQELRELEAMPKQISDESQFRAFVENAEEAISREHTMWYIRRNPGARLG